MQCFLVVAVFVTEFIFNQLVIVFTFLLHYISALLAVEVFFCAKIYIFRKLITHLHLVDRNVKKKMPSNMDWNKTVILKNWN